MRRAVLVLSVLSLLAMTISCGGSGSDTGHVGTSQVTITVKDSGRSASITTEKNSLLAMAERLFMVITGSGIALAQIPPDVTHILFTISAPDMVTIPRDVPVVGQSFITQTFTVPNGKNRCFSVQAQNASGNTLYGHKIYRNLDGQPVTIKIDMQDYAPPTFEGLQFAYPYSATEIDLIWYPASDYYTPAEDFVYQIYMVAETSGGQNFASPTYTTDPGVTYFYVTGLQPETTYFFVVRATDSNGNQDSNSIEISATTPEDTEPPTIVSVNPADGSQGIAARPIITVNFSEPMDPITITSDSFILYEDWGDGEGAFVEGTAEYSGTTATFTPSRNLRSYAYYTATVTSGVTDLAGNVMGEDYVWVFTVEDEPPTIVSVNPADGSQNVAARPIITVNFSEPMDPITITSTSFTLYYLTADVTPPEVYVEGTVAYSETVATFTPSADLDRRWYNATVTMGVTDLAGNPMEANYSWWFSVGLDDIPPTIRAVLPGQQSFNIPTDTLITVDFSEPMDLGSITCDTVDSTFTLYEVTITGGSGQSELLPCECTLTTRTMAVLTLTPPRTLRSVPDIYYVARVTNGVWDLARNNMAWEGGSYMWWFACFPPMIPPYDPPHFIVTP